jgi:hypothetical protein
VAGGINLYQFNGNNPVTFTDPFGLDPECSIEDPSDCPIVKLKVSIGLLPEQVHGSFLIGRLYASVGPKGAISGELTLGTGGLKGDVKMEMGLEATGGIKLGPLKIEGSDECVATTNKTGGCSREVSGGFGGTPVAVNGGFNLGNYVTAIVGLATKAYIEFKETKQYLRQMSTP